MSWSLSNKTKTRVHPNKTKEHERNDSVSSLSPSELDRAINDVLKRTERPNVLRCETICRDNPITSAGKKTQLVKMVSIVMIPVAVLTGLTANTFVNTFTSYMSSGIRNTILYSVELGQVVHSLQKERDMSALYISKISPVSKSFLLQRYPETDRSIEKLTFWTTLSRLEFQSKDKFLSYLNRHRYELDTLNQTVTKELEMYTTLIRVFIKWLYDTMTEEESGFIWRSLVAYLEVIIVKEYMGLERALGMVFYAKGRFPSRNVYLWFSESQDVSNATFLSARRYSDLVATLYNKNIKGNETTLSVLTSMRAEIRRNELNGLGSIKMAEWWYNNMTVYMDLLLETQSELAQEITGLLDERQKINLQKLIAISVVFVCVFVICPIIIYAAYKLTNEIQKYSINLTNRTKALNKEKKRTEALLHQMLPQSVATALTCNEVVDAENFDEATLFFSDIQGFTHLSARSSPIQVVEMLNSLYTCFDGRIALYDVYKVETIGDAYMVVSGLPMKNGIQHAAEISIMALDLLDHISLLKIPHLPGTKLKLRIGIHSGSVVAGIVGTKMPRYCLFGESVSIAAKMESLGKPGRIHISETTHDILFNLGGFTFDERKDEIIQQDRELMMILKGYLHTYWLINHDSRIHNTSTSTSSHSGDELSDYDNGTDDGDGLTKRTSVQENAGIVARGKVTSIH